MKACHHLEQLLSLRASGAPDALDLADAARLDAHLATCAACRAELEATAAVLALASLPPPSEAERRAARDLPARTLDALHAADRRVGVGRRFVLAAAGVAVAAGLAVVLVRPAGVQRTPATSAAAVAVAEPAAWQEPDLDDLWEVAELVDFEASAASGGDGAEAALAALDF